MPNNNEYIRRNSFGSAPDLHIEKMKCVELLWPEIMKYKFYSSDGLPELYGND